MNKQNFVFIVILVFFLSNPICFSQTSNQKKLPLTIILKNIELTYQVSFSYADKNIISKYVKKPKLNLTLNEVLLFLEKETKLKFKFLTQNSIIITLGLKKSIDIPTQILEEITVSDFLTKGISIKPHGNTQIKPQGFGILPGLIEPDVLQTIQTLPGVESADERISNLNIRGGTNDQNLILWDGIKMYQSGHFFGLISAFNPYLIDNVIISKNGTSAVYGDGISSIIDMRSSNDIEPKKTFGLGLNLINSDAYFKTQLSNNVGLQLSARRSLTDLISTPTYNEYYERIFQDTDLTNSGDISKNERFYFYDLSTKLLYDISPKEQLRFSLLNTYNALTYTEESNINQNDELLNSQLIQRNLALGISYHKKWNNKLSTSFALSASHYNLEALNNDISINQQLIQENEVLDTSLKLHLMYNSTNNINYFGGYQFSEIGISSLEDVNNPNFRRLIKKVLRTHSIFNEIAYSSKLKSTTFRFGLRTNYIDTFSKLYFEPRLSFSQRFLSNFRLELLGELKSQTSSQIIDLQNDFLGVEKRRWVLSNNEDIPIIKSKQFSIGLHYNKRGLLISGEVFMKQVDGITTRSQGFQNQYQYLNAVGKYKIMGIDILVSKQIQNLNAWFGYSISENKYSFKNLNFGNSFPNNLDIKHAFKLGSSLTLNKLKFAFGLNWRSGKPYTAPNEINPIIGNLINYDVPNSSNNNDYLRADVSAIYNFNFGKSINATAGFSIWNITNNKNIVNTYFSLNDRESFDKVELKSLGFTPNLSFRINF